MEQVAIDVASKEDLPQILNLQKEAYISEAIIYSDYSIQPLHQSLSEIEEEFEHSLFLQAKIQGNIVGSVRAYNKDDLCIIGKLIVDRTIQNQGLGKKLLSEIEAHFPRAKGFELFTGHKSKKNLYLYQKLGYKIVGNRKVSDSLTIVTLRKNTV